MKRVFFGCNNGKNTSHLDNNKLQVEKEEEIIPKGSQSTTESSKKTTTTKAPKQDGRTTKSTINVTDENVNFVIDERKNGEKSEDKGKISTTQSVSISDEDSKRKQEKEEEQQNEIVTVWSEWTECDRPDGRQVRRRVCRASSKACRGKLVESRSCACTLQN